MAKKLKRLPMPTPLRVVRTWVEEIEALDQRLRKGRAMLATLPPGAEQQAALTLLLRLSETLADRALGVAAYLEAHQTGRWTVAGRWKKELVQVASAAEEGTISVDDLLLWKAVGDFFKMVPTAIRVEEDGAHVRLQPPEAAVQQALFPREEKPRR